MPEIRNISFSYRDYHKSEGSAIPYINLIAIAIAAMKGNSFTSVPVAPCGICRQMIIEEEFRNKKKIKIIIYGEERILLIEDASSLLPLQFNQETLNPYPL